MLINHLFLSDYLHLLLLLVLLLVLALEANWN